MRSVRTALVVGVILVAINQGDVLLSGDWAAVSGWKIVLTFFVPYCVSTYAAVGALRDQHAAAPDDPIDTNRDTD